MHLQRCGKLYRKKEALLQKEVFKTSHSSQPLVSCTSLSFISKDRELFLSSEVFDWECCDNIGMAGNIS